ncbi:YczE/YyaS/YitT family protein [Nocardioides sp. Kera G14]|uniref:membrane protein YczE n=1 Tax=Nocardioides sp. Kera G14 TaxID=2884264 RepID=UPI001D117C71|nr:hypothetical protein [Nocardioides sp. Kera G14]UDY24790.1 hypothetical protein LH076_05685 [Nocardioides sp. Kera G14]
MTTDMHMTRRMAWLLAGLVLYGLSISMIVRAHIGLDPWSVLAQGIARTTGMSFGVVTDLVGVCVLLLWWPLSQRPGLGTVLNVLLVGPAADLGLWLIPAPSAVAARLLLFVAGVGLLSVATGLYLAPRLGPGPRDGLMTGLHSRFGWRLGWARTCVEVSVLIAGFLLGGQVGFGTALEALMIGPLVHRTVPWFRDRFVSSYGVGPVLVGSGS